MLPLAPQQSIPPKSQRLFESSTQVAAVSNLPPGVFAESANPCIPKTADNKFWIFGGQEFTNNCYADLWRYDPETNEWTWMSGSSVANFTGSYGNVCKPDSLNEPPARMENRFYSTDSCFNFWMFGGTNTALNEYYNDVW
jgi:hypothetical protein